VRLHLTAKRLLLAQDQANPLFTILLNGLTALIGVSLSETIVSSRTHDAGGASRDRTGDLKLAKLALSQLSYGPKIYRGHRFW
jgi:hypothetical protein